MLSSRRRPLVARAQERAILDEALREFHIVVLFGPGGVGKTALAINSLLGRAHPNDCLVDLAHAECMAEAFQAIADALDPTAHLAELTHSTLGGLLRRHATSLLVLDNMEQLGETGEELVHGLERETECRILVTSRRRLNLAGAHHIAVEPLTLTDSKELFLRRLNVHESARYKTSRLLDSIITRLDGLPLALELAADQVSVVTPARLLANLKQSSQTLSAEWKDRGSRHSSIRSMLAWSWRLLDKDERSIMAVCASLSNGVKIETIEELSRETFGLSQSETRRSLRRLLDSSWLRHTERGFSVLHLIREFLKETPQMLDVRPAHATLFSAKAKSLPAAAASCGLAFGELIRARQDIVSAFHWELSRATSSTSRLEAMLEGLEFLARYRGAIHGYHALLTSCRTIFEASARHAQLWYRLKEARAFLMLGEGGRALELLFALDEDTEDADPIVTEVQLRLGHVLAVAGRLDEAEDYLSRIAPHGASREGALRQMWMGFVATQCGDLKSARSLFEKAEQMFEDAADLRGQNALRLHLAHTYTRSGYLEDAEHVLRKAIQTAKNMLDRPTEACAKGNLGFVAHLLDRDEEAATYYEEALSELRDYGSRDLVGVFGLHRSILHLKQGQLESASAQLDTARLNFRQSLLPDREVSGAFHGILLQIRGCSRASLDVLSELRARVQDTDKARAPAFRLAELSTTIIESGRATPDAQHRWRAIAEQAEGSTVLLCRAIETHFVREGLLPAPMKPGEIHIHTRGLWLRVGSSDEVKLGERSPARRLLAALLRHRIDQPGQDLTIAQLIEEGWPSQRIGHSAALNRLRVTLSKLRKNGLSGALIHSDDGYRLDSTANICECF